jgi:hypothetical protein
LAHSDAMNVAWNYKRILRTEVVYTNYFAGSSNIYADKIPVPDFSALFAYPSINEKPYYNGGLSLNESIDLTSTGL